MNLNALLQAVDKAQVAARNATQESDYLTARRILTNTAANLETFLDEAEVTDAESRSSAASKLADIYGMLGGVEWRDKQLETALGTYQRGRKIEQDPKFRIVNSYNLVNSIVLAILIRPELFHEYVPDIIEAASTVKKQADGPRNTQWWAWADYGLLALLSGDEDAAIGAYENFATRDPRASDYESVERVLKDLRNALQMPAPDMANMIEDTIADLQDRKSLL